MPEVEHQLALQNMKQWLCCIIQLCDSQGQPFEGPLFYALFLNNLPSVAQWICTGETNDKNIFHVHALLKTHQRSDSALRAMRTEFAHMTHCENITMRFGQDPQFDCIKIQKCYKPESMLKYIMKSPKWVLSNNEPLLQLAYDIDTWDLNTKYKQTPESAADTSQMNPMTQDIIQTIISGSCKTMEECLRQEPQLMSKYLHRPGLQQIFNNCLQFVKATGGGWNISIFAQFLPNPEPIHAVLLHQGIVPSVFDLIFWNWINKIDTKRNTLVFFGPSNTGKTAFISGLKQIIPWGECCNGNNFNFEALVGNIIGVWEEPLINPDVAEKAKQIFEGMPCAITIKYRKPEILPRMPIIMTTNHLPWRFCQMEEEAFKNRMFIFNFDYQCKDQPIVYRASEHSCECYHCCTSRGCSPTHGGAESGRVQRANKPLSTGEHGTIRSPTEPDVGTRSMSDPGEGTSRRYDCGSSSTTSSADPECTYSTEPQRSSTTTTSRIIRRTSDVRSSNTGNRIRDALTVLNESMESHVYTGDHGYASKSDGTRPSGKHTLKRRHTTTRDDIQQHASSSTLGLLLSNTQTQEIQIRTKERRLDREMVSLTIPNKSDWNSYLSFLLHRYG